MYVLKLKRRTNLLKVSLIAVAVMLAACFVALAVRVEPSQATYPGQNGKIAFERFERCEDAECEALFQHDIFTVNPDGSDLTRITDHPANDSEPTWSPDGTRIAFQRQGAGVDLDIYTMNADGSDVHNVSNNAAYEAFPTWSPDGSKIAFMAGPRGVDTSDIYTVNADGSGETKLITGGWNAAPNWSPDGSKIAFSSNRSGQDNVWVMNADGSELTRLTNYDHAAGYLATGGEWSPDGSKILFVVVVDNNKWNKFYIYTMNADGSDQTNLTGNSPVKLLSEPHWSPDGSKIAFGRAQRGTGAVWVMNADGSGKTSIASGGRFAWSPDSTKIVFDPWESHMATVNVDGSGLTQVLDDFGSNPDWQPLPAPATKAECKNGGYEEFGFDNQGQCIASVRRAANSQ